MTNMMTVRIAMLKMYFEDHAFHGVEVELYNKHVDDKKLIR